ncbi:MAG: CDP-diacylglycerol--glycerol-3-phosphate 3-phosphatidyltransferase [Candidatus Ancillula sp.]|jgi:CDP-diacylglycerol--glycerol-3-phosphate 3-phosphatidyltransferase|nr:CDP-diacylglycerol--glycerol-3-phosphate 3-phosphatidyltransferase [Candidatus Ancillula sp.]
MTLANAVTILRIVVTLPFLVLVFSLKNANPNEIVPSAILFIIFLIISLSDNLDGYLARSRNEITELGKMLDPIADKLLLGGVLIVMNLVGIMPIWVSVLILFREIGITFLRMVVARKAKKVIAASKMGKLKTFLQTVSLMVFLSPFGVLPVWCVYMAWGILIAAIAVTYISGAQYVTRALKLWYN